MRKLVVIESPFAGETDEDVRRNVEYAQAAMRDSFRYNEFPIASHLLYPQVLDDRIPEERELGIQAGLAWGNLAEATVVYVDRGISSGMKYGIQHAQENHRPIEYRSIYSEFAVPDAE